MSEQRLEKYRPFFNPASIVIIGASRNKYTFSGIVIKNLLEAQYKGDIYVIHPYAEKILGIQCYPELKDLEDLDKKPELAIILTQNKMLDMLQQLGKMGIKHILIEIDVSVNLTEEKWKSLVEKYRSIIKEYDLHVLGPSMIGIIDFQSNFTTSILPTRSHILQPFESPKASKGISFFAQSGGLSGAMGWWQPDQRIPFAKVIHIGKAVNISEEEILEYLLQDPNTDVLIMFLRKITDKAIEVVGRYARSKPVLFKYAGRENPDGIKRMIEAGAFCVENYIELFDYAKLFLWCPRPLKNSVGIIGPSAGAISLLTSEMERWGIPLAKPEPENAKEILEKIGGSTGENGNPIDYWPPKEFVGTEVCKVYRYGSEILMRDKNTGIIMLALEFFNEIEFNFSIYGDLKKKYPNVPVICVLIQAESEGANRILNIADKLKIPVFINEPERAVRGVKFLIDYYNRKDSR